MSYSKTVEYLCTFDSKMGICNSIQNVKSLLSASAHITISTGKIKWKTHEFSLEMSKGDISGETDSIFYHFVFTNDKEGDSEKFQELLKAVRTILAKVSNENEPLTLRDDISSTYAERAYPIIHELENSMRKLITKFMITKVGRLSITDHLPGEVVDSVKVEGRKSINENFLYKTDFIQLSNFLFREFSTHKSDSIYSIISKADAITADELQHLKDKLPMSNWDRYFKPVIKCSSEELKANWEILYKLRCIVAHNNFMSKGDYEVLLSRAEKVSKIIQEALDRLSEVEVKEAEKSDILDGVNININEQYGVFLNSWKSLVNSIDKILKFVIGMNEEKAERLSFRSKIEHLIEFSILEEDERRKIYRLLSFRNRLVHTGEQTTLDLTYFTSLTNYYDDILKVKLGNRGIIEFSFDPTIHEIRD
ncbi:HEPN domain-containing protein [Acinetobacter guillouiae]|uniref:HEPN domain-containing protein n=1 Tax=Acinetobacter guillouiae TaxID=106649 RepID=UPI001CD4B47A|nr:HEPN domain-containing protein [Acinetobacter guillouiae]